MPITHTRRRSITTLSLADAGLIHAPRLMAGEGRPETTLVRLAKRIPVLRNAPQYIADDLLRAGSLYRHSICCFGAGRRADQKNRRRGDRLQHELCLRAILKAADYCAVAPTAIARPLVDSGFSERYEYAAQRLSESPFDKSGEYDAEDTIRFYALRMHEAGMIKTTPQKIIGNGTDWRFLNELKRELKT